MTIKNQLFSPYILVAALFAVIVIYYLLMNDSSGKLFPKAEARSQQRMAKLPNFSKITDVKEKKETFFSTLYPIIQEENMHVLKLRARIIDLKGVPVAELTKKEQEWIFKIAKHYKQNEDVIEPSLFDNLLTKIDYIPPSLALTQAAIESGWGSSRFSKQGNNLFGQWCFSRGCGMVPSSRDSGKDHEVAKFETVNHAVRAYIQNLNTNQSYIELRKKRAQLREKNEPLTGIALAKTLTKYSEEGSLYIAKVSKFINQNKLQRFTAEFESSMLVVSN